MKTFPLRQTSSALAAGLVLAVSGCGGEEQGALIAPERAETLLDTLDDARSDFESGDCDKLQSDTLPALEQQVSDVSSDVDEGVRTALDQETEDLQELADDCKQAEETTPTVPETTAPPPTTAPPTTVPPATTAPPTTAPPTTEEEAPPEEGPPEEVPDDGEDGGEGSDGGPPGSGEGPSGGVTPPSGVGGAPPPGSEGAGVAAPGGPRAAVLGGGMEARA